MKISKFKLTIVVSVLVIITFIIIQTGRFIDSSSQKLLKKIAELRFFKQNYDRITPPDLTAAHTDCL